MLLQELNHTFITLISKNKKGIELGEFRPILCCNVLYKLESKILANRLSKILGGFDLSKCLWAFLSNRQFVVFYFLKNKW